MNRGGNMLLKRRNRIIIYVLLIVLIRVVTFLADKLYYEPKELPSFGDVTYSIQKDFVVVGCQIYSLDSVEKVEVHYNDVVLKMNYNGNDYDKKFVRYVVQMPIVDENVEVKIVAYELDGDKATYIIEK